MSCRLRRKTTMTIQTQILRLIPRDYEVFGGLDADHHSISTTFADHGRLMKSLRLPYSSAQVLNYVRKHFPRASAGVCLPSRADRVLLYG